MKVLWLKVLTVAGEFLIDLVTGKLEKKPARGLSHLDSERIARASREAGPPCDKAPPGWRCYRRRNHEGPCAARRRNHEGPCAARRTH